MKLRFHCSQCFDSGKPTKHLLDANEAGYYEFRCECGHHEKIIFPKARHDLLLQLAILALVDGHYRETVNSCQAALERFYEFYIRFVQFKKNIKAEESDKTWRNIKKQSERQLGGFLVAYAIENSKACPFFDENHFKFRNNITHKGVIPTYDEALGFAQNCVNFIKERLQEMWHSSKAEMKAFELKEIEALSSKHGGVDYHLTMWTVLIEAFKEPLGSEFDIRPYVKQVRQFRNQW